MPFPDNTPGINELINLPVGEIALLPLDLLAAMQLEIDAAAKQMKAVTARFNTALEVRFATRAAEVRSASGKDSLAGLGRRRQDLLGQHRQADHQDPDREHADRRGDRGCRGRCHRSDWPGAAQRRVLMSAFAAAVGALFADPNMGQDAVYTADGGGPVLVRVVARRTDAVTDFGDARLWSETTRVDLRLAEVPNPRPGERVEIDGDAFLIQGEPVRDRERLVWTVDLRPA